MNDYDAGCKAGYLKALKNMEARCNVWALELKSGRNDDMCVTGMRAALVLMLESIWGEINVLEDELNDD